MTASALVTTDLVPAGIKAGTAHMAFPIYEKVPPGCVPWPVMGDPMPRTSPNVLRDGASR